MKLLGQMGPFPGVSEPAHTPSGTTAAGPAKLNPRSRARTKGLFIIISFATKMEKGQIDIQPSEASITTITLAVSKAYNNIVCSKEHVEMLN